MGSHDGVRISGREESQTSRLDVDVVQGVGLEGMGANHETSSGGDHRNSLTANINPSSLTKYEVSSAKEILPFHIGGPNTCLPFFVESFLGWGLCLSCLSVSGYHYAKSILLSSNWYLKFRNWMQRWVSSKIRPWSLGLTSERRTLKTIGVHINDLTEERKWIPLTTYTRAELGRHSPWESYLSLVRILENEYPETLVPVMALNEDGTKLDGVLGVALSSSSVEETLSIKQETDTLTVKADAALIRVLRHDDVCRRLASLAMRPYDVTIETTVTTTKTIVSTISPAKSYSSAESHTTTSPTTTVCNSNHATTTTTTLLKQFPHNHLLQRMSNVWNLLLALPALEEAKTFYRIPTTNPPRAETSCLSDGAYSAFKISLIMPSYNEEGSHLQVKLSKALDMASSPEEVEVIIVDAGGCSDLEMILKHKSETGCDSHNSKQWGRICIVSFSSGGGRGPCLNHGAQSATGRILTFCHSDTTLPRSWDERIVATLEHDSPRSSNHRRLGTPRANSCSFQFGIDTSPEGLSMPFASSSIHYNPPGIRAVETTANMRSYLYSLPYGDSTLSLHACVFHFLGGYPDQCLMEDYELVSLLRLRAAFCGNEKLAMMRGPPALCSPRRWQKFGVLYVTFMNSKLVNLYAGSMKVGSDDLFRQYYGKDPPKREFNCSPWEIELDNRLNGAHST
ncbi:hypothetical protein HJC23_003578 [Cyclotella cryptica]|uniref:Glycosyltransferase 2-like domain-containing protein n=1 Tax=Cyclotella cryptica TaxID=29204 RepID=A0ABD3NVM4_9STRA|eukprot:CCRYP_019486-RA/>CCRYP_019486-RA protein AED:0.36 eAED:0.36 QI:0/-1/0/1/-1/1/1/0/680